jgi:hypothetical protein
MNDNIKPKETIAYAKEVIRDIRVEHGVDESFLRKIAEDPDIQKAWLTREKQLKNALKE